MVAACSYIQLPLERSKFRLTKEDRQYFQEKFLVVHHECLALVDPGNDVVEPVKFCIGQQIVEFAWELLQASSAVDFLLGCIIFWLLHHGYKMSWRDCFVAAVRFLLVFLCNNFFL